MSGLDKTAQRRAAAAAEEEATAPQLEPSFPFVVIEFDPVFFGVK